MRQTPVPGTPPASPQREPHIPADVSSDLPTLAASLSATMAADARAVGQTLARLREARGWSVADVSVRLKFSERQIAALEIECWAELPQGLSLRGLIRNYAKLLDADADALLTALAPHIGMGAGGRVQHTSQLSSDRAAHLLSQKPRRGRMLAWGAVGVIALALLAAITVFALDGWPGRDAPAVGGAVVDVPVVDAPVVNGSVVDESVNRAD